MRSILLIFLTIVLVAGGFFAYLWFQPEPASTTGAAGPTSAPVALVPASRPAEVPDPNLLGGGGASTNIYIMFRLRPLGGEPKCDGDEVAQVGYFSLEEIERMDRVLTLDDMIG